MTAILIDFNTIIDPVALLSCLITFRNTHDRIYVRSESLIYRWHHDPVERSLAENFGSLRDAGFLHIAPSICKRSKDDLRLQQHALDEGIITTLNDSFMGPWEGDDKMIDLQTLQRIPSFEYINHNLFDGGKYGNIILTTDKPGQRYDDLRMSLKQCWDVAIGGRTFSPLEMIANSKSKLYDLGYQAEVIRLLNAESFKTYTTLIDNPKLLPTIAEATKKVVHEENYKDKLRWFLPRFALSKLSMGTYTLVEMLWIIARHERIDAVITVPS
jgi:hypothetical protein